MNHFENIIIIGRPGSGKSEIVDLLRKIPLPKRLMTYHVGEFIECDDFVYVIEKLREDEQWEQLGVPRKYSKKVPDGVGVVADLTFWDFCLEMLNKEIVKSYFANENFYEQNSLFIEFSRGAQKGYHHSLSLFDDRILSRSVILHLDITYDEALGRNEIRHKGGQHDSKLYHKVPLEQMESFYKTSDWEELSQGQAEGFVTIRDHRIPFVSLKNHPAPANDLELSQRVASSFHKLFSMKYGQYLPRTTPVAVSENPTFDNLILLGRPASGKSEFIDFVKKTPIQDRISLFHIGQIEELDDYKFLAQKFQEEDIWQKVTGSAKYSHKEQGGNTIDDIRLFDFALSCVNQLAVLRYVPNQQFYEEGTLFIEFSRGCDLKYADSLAMLDAEVLKRAAIFYVNTSFEECWRRNVARFQEKAKHSILAHMVPRTEMERTYLTDDWKELTQGREVGTMTVKGINVPFVTLDNEIESKDPIVLTERYKTALAKLKKLYRRSE